MQTQTGKIGRRRWVIEDYTVFFADRDPAGPYSFTVPRDTDYASAIEPDVPIICQHTRLDLRQSELPVMTTIPPTAQIRQETCARAVAAAAQGHRPKMRIIGAGA
jgi:hypothetical protein